MDTSNFRSSRKLNPGYHYSFLQKMRDDKTITDEFESVLMNLPLEDIIALKLELSSQKFNHKMFGFPILSAVKFIVEEAVIRYAFSVSPDINSALKTMGINMKQFRELQKSHRIKDEFHNEEKRFQLQDMKLW